MIRQTVYAGLSLPFSYSFPSQALLSILLDSSILHLFSKLWMGQLSLDLVVKVEEECDITSSFSNSSICSVLRFRFISNIVFPFHPFAFPLFVSRFQKEVPGSI